MPQSKLRVRARASVAKTRGAHINSIFMTRGFRRSVMSFPGRRFTASS